MDKYLGKKLDGRYEITELIGIGGMANVYKAYDVAENRVVAVKVLREEYMENDDMRRRFKNESKAMAVLNHPNVMRVYDVSFSDRLQSIVMEYIDGITLKEYIEQQGMLKWKEAVHFTVQILRALQHAHDKGIVHRDIKPQNIMLLSDGTIKITDFGIARFARSETRTLTDRAIGSVHYISPEQAAGDVIDARTDIYSVGVMLYEMLTGQVPFEADSPVSVALKQIQSKAALPRTLNPSIPEGLQAITMHAMEKDVQKRYQSAAQMLRDIDEFKRDPSISFAYKYLDAPLPGESGKYSSAIQSARKGGAKKERADKQRRAPIIPVLAGVTAGFVIVTAVFIGWMLWLNNPFVTVGELPAPNLVGEKFDNVRISDKYAQFEIIMPDSPEYNSEYGKGVIYEQSPKAGTSIKEKSQIRVKVSKGQQTVTLPNYAGWDLAQVKAQLDEWGLKYDEKPIFDSTIPIDSVVKTAPGEGAQVNAGETVYLYVSLGKEEKLVTVPDLYGISPEDAKVLLENFKLKITVKYDEEYDDADLEGLIVKQSPAAESQVQENAPVEVTVAGVHNTETKTSLFIALPREVKDEVQLRATMNGVEVAKETVIPAELKVWKPVFSGEGLVEIKIFYNGEVYQVYDLDFEPDTPAFRLKEDYQDEFTE